MHGCDEDEPYPAATPMTDDTRRGEEREPDARWTAPDPDPVKLARNHIADINALLDPLTYRIMADVFARYIVDHADQRERAREVANRAGTSCYADIQDELLRDNLALHSRIAELEAEVAALKPFALMTGMRAADLSHLDALAEADGNDHDPTVKPGVGVQEYCDIMERLARPDLAAQLTSTRAEVEALRVRVAKLTKGRKLSPAPCDQCGYNGPGYYQPNTHPCAIEHHAAESKPGPGVHEACAIMDRLARPDLAAEVEALRGETKFLRHDRDVWAHFAKLALDGDEGIRDHLRSVLEGIAKCGHPLSKHYVSDETDEAKEQS